MFNTLINVILGYLVSFFFFGSSLAFSYSKKEVALVEVFEEVPTKWGSDFRHKLERNLIQSKKVRVISADKVAAYFNKTIVNDEALTPGDKLYQEAQRLFLNFDLEGAQKIADQAIGELQKKPGTQGSLIKASLLKAQSALEMNSADIALKATEEAISYNVSAVKLDDYYYAPKFQRFYGKIYSAYISTTPLLDITVYDRGEKDLPVYVNGVLRGYGPTLTIKAPKIARLHIMVGDSPKAPVIRIDAGEASREGVSVVGKKIAVSTSPLRAPIGFKNDSKSSLTDQAIGLGMALSADEVVLIKVDELQYLNRMTLNVVDVKTGAMSPARQIDVVDIEDDLDSAAQVAGKFIDDWPSSRLAKAEKEADTPVLVGKKKSGKSSSFFKKPVAWIVIGTLVIGAGVGAALGMGGGGGGGGGGESTTTTTSISGPAPDTP